MCRHIYVLVGIIISAYRAQPPIISYYVIYSGMLCYIWSYIHMQCSFQFDLFCISHYLTTCSMSVRHIYSSVFGYAAIFWISYYTIAAQAWLLFDDENRLKIALRVNSAPWPHDPVYKIKCHRAKGDFVPDWKRGHQWMSDSVFLKSSDNGWLWMTMVDHSNPFHTVRMCADFTNCIVGRP